MTCSWAANVAAWSGADHHAAAGQALADVVVGIAAQPDRDAARQERAERLPGRPAQADRDRVVGQALAAPAPGDLVAQHGADGPVHVPDRQVEADRLALLKRTLGQLDQRVVQRQVQWLSWLVVLRLRRAGRQRRHVQQRRQVEEGRLARPPARRPSAARPGRRPRPGAEAHHGQVLADLPGDELEEGHHVLRAAGETRRAARGSGWRRRPGRCRCGRPASSRSPR